ncbi:endonuclease/exonuclease/phosphatase family protein [Xanthomonas bonasiae]|uniref:endonuclease/exonuclease/phosphatase family protein n=1 Tax=Xanthomonas bonasiae TaxID=2810351 RepID=UPI00197F24D0|nr:endonuclease/exonuclease/phosphatase family protein [Xanthomonas bonasiae]MBN6112746.1 endonuclease/exonuclease/phosphatase family protein [Xanthomonas bonasiae]
MRVLFWNLESGNPMEMGMDGKGSLIQSAINSLHCDVVICCEVQDAAIDFAEIESIKKAAALEVICEEEKIPSPYVNIMAARRAKLNKAKTHIGMESSRTRSGMKFKSRNHILRTNKKIMRELGSAVRAIEDPGTLASMIATARQPKVILRLSRVQLSPLIWKYHRWEALDSQQKHRNYLIFTNLDFKMTQVEVNVTSAKRQIVRLEFVDRVIYAVHAPAFGKGGGETVKQLAGMIAVEQKPCIAIGDLNIDLEEFRTEVAEDTSKALFANFHNNLCACFGPPPGTRSVSFRRRWHAYRGNITKYVPHTQKSGGTLDYVLAKPATNVSVSIGIEVGRFSDHGAIVAEWS